MNLVEGASFHFQSGAVGHNHHLTPGEVNCTEMIRDPNYSMSTKAQRDSRVPRSLASPYADKESLENNSDRHTNGTEQLAKTWMTKDETRRVAKAPFIEPAASKQENEQDEQTGQPGTSHPEDKTNGVQRVNGHKNAKVIDLSNTKISPAGNEVR